MEYRKILYFFGAIFICITLYYTVIYAKVNSNQKTTQEQQSVYDIDTVSSEKVESVEKTYKYFELDTNGNFLPKNELTRIEGIVIIDKLAKDFIKSYSTTKPTIVPYFEDFKISDENGEEVLRVVHLIDNKENFYKHYNILSYKLKRQETLTNREFLTLLSVLIPVNKDLGDDYIIKNLSNYGIDNIPNLDDKIIREDAACYIDKIIKDIK